MAGYIVPESGDRRVQNLLLPVEIMQNGESWNLHDYGMMATGLPYVSRQQERLEMATIPGLHGSLIKPSFKDLTNTQQNWETRTGSLDFYYVPDGENHVLWDEYMMSVYENRVAGVTHAHPWCFFGQYHSILHRIQGRRFLEFYMPGNEGGFGDNYVGMLASDRHRAWLSKVKPDSSGRTTVTLSYEMLPSGPYCDIYDYE